MKTLTKEEKRKTRPVVKKREAATAPLSNEQIAAIVAMGPKRRGKVLFSVIDDE